MNGKRWQQLLLNSILVILIVYQWWAHWNQREGMESSTDTDILAVQNAGNIEVLKQRFTDIQPTLDSCGKMQVQIDNLQTQMDDLSNAQQEYTSQMVGTEPPTVSGAVDEEDDE